MTQQVSELDILPYLSTLRESSREQLEEVLEKVLVAKDSLLVPRQIRDIEPVRSWLRSRYYNILAPNLYEYWENEIVDFIEGNYNEWVISGCFIGDTEILLYDGERISLRDLSLSPESSFEVYSVDSQGRIVPGNASLCRKTGLNREVWTIVFDNDREVTCTPDHRFLVKDGTYVRADRLSSADSLVSLNSPECRVVSAGFSHFEDIYDLEVEEYHNFALAAGMFVHNSIGTGKSTAALITSLRKLYELSCYDIPQRLFRLADVTKIFFAYLSINQKQAELTGFGQIRAQVDSTRYFQDKYPRDPNINSVLKFPGGAGVFFIPGSDRLAVLGTNLFGAVLDEVNFLKAGGAGPAGDVAKAQEIYQEITDRRRSRFMYKGKDPGFSLLVSSSSVQTSFTASRIRNADPTCKVTNTRLWEVKPSGTYSERTFFVFNGSDNEDAYLITHIRDIEDLIDDPVERERLSHAIVLSDKAGQDLIKDIIPALPEHVRLSLTEVPVDFKRSFETDLYAALRNIAGLSIAPAGKLFSSNALWRRAMDESLYHPFTKTEFTLTLRGDDSIMEYFRVDKFFNEKGPVKNPHAPRFLRVDQSKNHDRTGLACCHRASYYCQGSGIRQPIIEVDFQLAIRPPPKPDKIGFHKIRAFILALRALGTKIALVTFDQYQSEDHMQLLSLERVSTAYLSVDRNDKAHRAFVNLLNEGRVKMYPHARFKTEFFALNWDRAKHKVDHPAKNPDGTEGSKDVVDAAIGAVYSCISFPNDGYLERKEALAQIRAIGPEKARKAKYGGEKDFSWLVADYPVDIRDKVHIQTKLMRSPLNVSVDSRVYEEEEDYDDEW